MLAILDWGFKMNIIMSVFINGIDITNGMHHHSMQHLHPSFKHAKNTVNLLPKYQQR